VKIKNRLSEIVHNTYHVNDKDLRFEVSCHSVRIFYDWNIEIVSDDIETTCLICIRIEKQLNETCPKCGAFINRSNS